MNPRGSGHNIKCMGWSVNLMSGRKQLRESLRQSSIVAACLLAVFFVPATASGTVFNWPATPAWTAGSGASAVVAGTALDSNTSANGNVNIDSGTQSVDSVTFQFSNSYTGTHQFNNFGISPITFTGMETSFPEVGSAVGALALCGGVLAVGRVRKRRPALLSDGSTAGAKCP